MMFLNSWKLTHSYDERVRMSYILAILLLVVVFTILGLVWWAFTWVGVLVLIFGGLVAVLIIWGICLIVTAIADLIYDILFQW